MQKSFIPCRLMTLTSSVPTWRTPWRRLEASAAGAPSSSTTRCIFTLKTQPVLKNPDGVLQLPTRSEGANSSGGFVPSACPARATASQPLCPPCWPPLPSRPSTSWRRIQVPMREETLTRCQYAALLMSIKRRLKMEQQQETGRIASVVHPRFCSLQIFSPC